MRVTVVLDALDPDALVDFWSQALDYHLVDSFAQYRVLAPREGPGPVLALQRVAEPRPGKNRMHLDLHPDAPEKLVLRLQRLGATTVGVRMEEFDTWWQVMADPEGNEFCVIAGGQGPDEGSASTG